MVWDIYIPIPEALYVHFSYLYQSLIVLIYAAYTVYKLYLTTLYSYFIVTPSYQEAQRLTIF